MFLADYHYPGALKPESYLWAAKSIASRQTFFLAVFGVQGRKTRWQAEENPGRDPPQP